MRISVTQLETFQQCQVKYDYRHRRHLRPNDAKESAALSVGRAVADCLEVGLLSESPRAAAIAKADGDQRVIRCLRVMPDDVWAITGIAEDKLEVPIGKCSECHGDGKEVWPESWEGELPNCPKCGGSGGRHTLVGKPDLWYVEYDSDQSPQECKDTTCQCHGNPLAVHIVEFKTTGDPKSKAMAKAVGYEDWGEQATRYAALLWKQYEWLRDIPFYRRHILLSWHEKANLAYPGRRLLVSQRALEQSLVDMERIADDAERVYEGAPITQVSVFPIDDPVGPVHHYSATCGWCEFGPICQANLRSGDTEYVIETAYTERKE